MRSAFLAVLATVLVAPAGASAQSSPFQPLPPSSSDQTQTTAPAPSTAADNGISSLQETLLIGAGILFVLGIGVLIARDARRTAPTDPRPARAGDEALDGPGARRKPDPRAAQKQKAAAKRARQARKKNRPVRK